MVCWNKEAPPATSRRNDIGRDAITLDSLNYNLKVLNKHVYKRNDFFGLIVSFSTPTWVTSGSGTWEVVKVLILIILIGEKVEEKQKN